MVRHRAINPARLVRVHRGDASMVDLHWREVLLRLSHTVHWTVHHPVVVRMEAATVVVERHVSRLTLLLSVMLVLRGLRPIGELGLGRMRAVPLTRHRVVLLLLLQVTVISLSVVALLRSGVGVHSMGVRRRVKASMTHVHGRVASHSSHLRRHAHAHTWSVHAHVVHRVTSVLHGHWRRRHGDGEMSISSTLRDTRERVIEHTHEWGRKVNVGRGLLLDILQDHSKSTGDNGLKLVVDLAHVNVMSCLVPRSACEFLDSCQGWCVVNTYEFI